MSQLEKYSKEFREKAIGNGFSSDEIQKCLIYAIPILEKNLPVIYNTSHLSSLVGYNKKYLKRASGYSRFFYKEHIIKKRNGKTRTLNEPLPSLKEIQSWIKDNILEKIPISRYAKAYSSGRSIKDHVKFHKGYKFVLTLDIEDFFGSIDLEVVEKIFLKSGYSKLISNLLAKICTYENSLPQGAPSSPTISNIVLNPLDNTISEYCRLKGIRYTRYADDLAFSGDNMNEIELIHLISKSLRDISKLKLNTEKTMLMKNNERQVISGIIVNEKIQIPRKKRDELRQAMYYIDKFGLEDHLQWIKCTKSNYIKHLLGIANYINFINPNDKEAKEIMSKLHKMIKN